jgi:hypothetical protein
MDSDTYFSSSKILEAINKENEGKFGIICLNCLIVRIELFNCEEQI